MVKASVLRKKNEEQLNKDLEEFRKNLAELKFNKASASQQMKVSKLRTVRKDIARVLTVLNTMKKDEAREKYAKAKYQPLDLRAKKTRKIRRKMTRHQRRATTLKERKRAENFPQRTFAVMQ
ncbi:unnamed protein product [Moneuplotes crassus]|uniref:60S ribosomal protein L35 n=1 Tax=Euplotes crassus TaxID=5936 RepID=A0A7S3KQH5_EUPCR|nr:unnamed protein product [Moneuplotes crassus]|mmetsp:Transcript_39760/g.39358  ORF Transcript_39760/g.39358 Transcript_39760/m.39358 type:complete len:122 (+) Transcript_39760:25-390(+)|eukprot:CAMPEP_0196995820 /NCGR_PEP_ID=MMETSP1380-20130617/1849_1 /TAXON_ID=5936 /ORGANISM="Euplotes crassus, Strain CT5" /LENGTH=121 /DNA_ID=CAMNT_0042411605 /DNA_START=21 /DNA_END=386 /DNA_ORIENTATION=+